MAHIDAESLRGEEDVYQWYTAEIDSIPLPMQELMEKHSGLSPDRTIPHISELVCLQIPRSPSHRPSPLQPTLTSPFLWLTPKLLTLPHQRDRAWHLFPYPCIGQLRFLNLNLSTNSLYGEILSRLTTQSQTLLDAGCCFGQDLRKLSFDGAPPASLYGLDVEPAFLELGYDLFLDRDRDCMKGATFISGNLLKPKGETEGSLPQLEAAIDIIHASSLFHLFAWDEQVRVATRLADFTKPKPGCMILGRQVGAMEAGDYRGLHEGSSSYRHNFQSFQQLWTKVGEKTGTRWKVDAWLDMTDVSAAGILGQKWTEKGTRRLHFVVMRE